jgi:hypothetical protein
LMLKTALITTSIMLLLILINHLRNKR